MTAGGKPVSASARCRKPASGLALRVSQFVSQGGSTPSHPFCQARRDVKYAWRKVRNDLALDDEVVPYSLRHTVARHLRASGVDAWQVAAQLGHKQLGHSTTEIYAPFDPTYLADSVAVLDKYLKDILISPDDMLITCSLHAQIEARRKANEEAKSLKRMVGGTRFELVTPTMST